MTLREQVDALLPGWENWYPSLFDAATDLGLIRSRVCSPSSLLLTNRHASIQSQAMQAHRDRWGGLTEDVEKRDASPAKRSAALNGATKKAPAKPRRRRRRKRR